MSHEQDPSLNQNKGLHVCPNCSSGLVQPTRWEHATEAGKRVIGSWRIWLRCPECEHTENKVADEKTIDAYDQKLDAATGIVTKQLRQMESDNMARAADSFAIALEHDLINADDFHPRTGR